MKNKTIWFLLFLFTGFIPSLLSQNNVWEAQLDTMRNRLETGEYQVVLTAINQIEKEITNVQLSDIFTLKGTTFRYINDLDSAIIFHNKALKIRAKLPNEESKLANSHLNLGNCYLTNQQLTKANFHYQKAKTIKEQTLSTNAPELIGIYNSLGNFYQTANQPKDALFYLKKVLSIAEEGEKKNPIPQVIAHISIANFWYEQRLPDSAIYHLNAALNLQQLTASMPARTATIYNNKGNAYAQKKQLQNAEQAIKQAISIYQKLGKNFDNKRAMSYLNMGNLFIDNGNTQKAIVYLQNAATIAKEDVLLSTQINNSLGVAHQQMDEFKLAKDYLKKAMNGYRNIKDNQAVAIEIGNVNANFGQLSLSEGQVNKAKYYYEKAFNIYQENNASKNIQAFTLLKLANLSIESADFDAAENYLMQAGIYISDKNPRLVFLWHFRWGNWWEAQDKFVQAVDFYGEANSVLHNYKIEKKLQAPFSFEKLSVLGALSRVHARSTTPKDWSKGLKLTEQAFLILKNLKGNFDDSQTEMDIQNTFYNIYNTAIDLCLKLADTNKIYAHQAFQIAEDYRGNLLKKLVQKAKFNSKFSGISDFTNQEKELQQTISFYQKRRYELSKTDFFDKTQVARLDSLILNNITKKDALKNRIEQQYPAYYQLLYDYPITKITEIQAQLNNDQSVLMYQWGTSDIWCFLVNKDTFLVKAIPDAAKIKNSIETLSKLYPVKVHVQPKAAKEAIFTEFVESSHDLYQQLIAPFAPFLKYKLSILPDGPLYHLPFEVLIKEPAEKTRFFRTHQYLLSEHAVHYHYAAQFLLPSKQQSANAAKNILSIAPVFQDTALILRHNEREAQQIYELLGGDLWVTGTDSKERFYEFVQDYSVLHLSTHGFTNDRFPEYSFLTFSNVVALHEDAQLFVPEIYDLPLDNTKMVVLSACQTANGKTARGEGLLSLAHAFSFAGAKCLVASLWNVDDSHTPDLMHDYYQFLKDGDAKSVAMQKAKKKYLESASQDAAYPFYWAGFLVIGEDTPIQDVLNENNFLDYWWLLLLLFGAFSWVFFRKKRKPT